jgi:MobA/MobL family
MAAIGYHFSAKVISRTRGQSAVASAAYRIRGRLEDQRYGKTHDYSKHEGIEFVWHSAPKNAPEWAQDIGQAWNVVEREEKKSNSTLAREYVVAFPHQLTAEQRAWMLKDFVREELTRKGLMVTAAIHAPSRDGDERNYHAHIMFSDRPLDENGFVKNKDRSFTEFAERKQTLGHSKEKWAGLAARQLERAGYSVEAERWRHGHEKLGQQVTAATARGDHEYAEVLRFREASKHLGVVATEIERDGRESHRGRENREIETGNAQRQELGKELQKIEREIAALEKDEPNVIRLYRGIGNNVAPQREGGGAFFSTNIDRARGFGELHFIDLSADEFAELKCPHSKRILEAEPIAKDDYRIYDADILNRLQALNPLVEKARLEAAAIEESRKAAERAQQESARKKLIEEKQAATQEITAKTLGRDQPQPVEPPAPRGASSDQEQKRQERQATAAQIREAWQGAERDPVAFVIALGEQGLTLAENEKGRFVAVNERGYAHYLSAAALGEPPQKVQRELETAFKGEGSISLPTVDELKAERRGIWAASKAEEVLGWKASRSIQQWEREATQAAKAEEILSQDAHRRAAARERQAEDARAWETAKAMRAMERETERVAAAQERPLNEVKQDIGRAWADSGSGAEFVHELEQRGLIVCRVTAEEAERSKNQRAWLKTASYQEGEYLAVTEWGGVYRLNAETIGLTAVEIHDHIQNVAARLAEIEPDSVVTLHEAQDIITAQRAEQTVEMDTPMIEVAESIGDGIETAMDAADHAASKGVEIIGRMGAVIANGLESFFFGGASRQAPGGAESTQEAKPQPKQTREQKQETQPIMKEVPAWLKAKQQLNREPELANEANTRDLITNHPLQVSPEMYAAMRRREEQERERNRER